MKTIYEVCATPTLHSFMSKRIYLQLFEVICTEQENVNFIPLNKRYPVFYGTVLTPSGRISPIIYYE